MKCSTGMVKQMPQAGVVLPIFSLIRRIAARATSRSTTLSMIEEPEAQAQEQDVQAEGASS